MHRSKQANPITVNDLSKKLKAKIYGNGDLVLTGVAPLEEAGPNDLSFVKDSRFLKIARSTKAGCLIMGDQLEFEYETCLRVNYSAHRAFTQAMRMMYKKEHEKAEISPSAEISTSAEIGDDVIIGSNVVIEKNCKIGSKTKIMAGTVVMEGSEIGEECCLHPGSVIYNDVQIKNRVEIGANAVIGSDGFGFDLSELPALRMPQIGSVLIGNDVVIGAGTNIEKASMGVTKIGNRAKIGELVIIGHHSTIGEDTVIIGQSGISGSASVGSRCLLSGQVGVRGYVEIGDDSEILAKSAVMSNVPSGSKVGGSPAVNHLKWKRGMSYLKELPDLLRKLRERVSKLEQHLNE